MINKNTRPTRSSSLADIEQMLQLRRQEDKYTDAELKAEFDGWDIEDLMTPPTAAEMRRRCQYLRHTITITTKPDRYSTFRDLHDMIEIRINVDWKVTDIISEFNEWVKVYKLDAKLVEMVRSTNRVLRSKKAIYWTQTFSTDGTQLFRTSHRKRTITIGDFDYKRLIRDNQLPSGRAVFDLDAIVDWLENHAPDTPTMAQAWAILEMPNYPSEGEWRFEQVDAITRDVSLTPDETLIQQHMKDIHHYIDGQYPLFALRRRAFIMLLRDRLKDYTQYCHDNNVPRRYIEAPTPRLTVHEAETYLEKLDNFDPISDYPRELTDAEADDVVMYEVGPTTKYDTEQGRQHVRMLMSHGMIPPSLLSDAIKIDESWNTYDNGVRKIMVAWNLVQGGDDIPKDVGLSIEALDRVYIPDDERAPNTLISTDEAGKALFDAFADDLFDEYEKEDVINVLLTMWRMRWLPPSMRDPSRLFDKREEIHVQWWRQRWFEMSPTRRQQMAIDYPSADVFFTKVRKRKSSLLPRTPRNDPVEQTRSSRVPPTDNTESSGLRRSSRLHVHTFPKYMQPGSVCPMNQDTARFAAMNKNPSLKDNDMLRCPNCELLVSGHPIHLKKVSRARDDFDDDDYDSSLGSSGLSSSSSRDTDEERHRDRRRRNDNTPYVPTDSSSNSDTSQVTGSIGYDDRLAQREARNIAMGRARDWTGTPPSSTQSKTPSASPPTATRDNNNTPSTAVIRVSTSSVGSTNTIQQELDRRDRNITDTRYANVRGPARDLTHYRQLVEDQHRYWLGKRPTQPKAYQDVCNRTREEVIYFDGQVPGWSGNCVHCNKKSSEHADAVLCDLTMYDIEANYPANPRAAYLKCCMGCFCDSIDHVIIIGQPWEVVQPIQDSLDYRHRLPNGELSSIRSSRLPINTTVSAVLNQVASDYVTHMKWIMIIMDQRL